MPRHYLWAIGEGIKTYRPGEIIAERYQVQHGNILLDTQPEKMPQMPEEIPGVIEPYLKLFPYRLHIPQVFGLAPLTETKGNKIIWLLEGGPINQEEVSLVPEITTAWKDATPMRQLNWLWQIAQLWQPLNVQKVGSSLLNPENLRVEGQLVRLVELQRDEKSLTLQHLGQLWQQWVSSANPVVEKFLKQLCQQMIAGEVQNADLVITQLDTALEVLGRAQVRSVHITTATDTGPNRDHNEDACHPPSQTVISYPPSSKTVAIVCDGIGGQDRGEEASQLAIKVLYQQLQNIPENADPLTLTTKLEEFACVANDAICECNDREERHGRERMGTTLVMALAHLHQLYITHLGDSRAYWITPRGCHQVTLDDDVASRQVRLGYSLYHDAIKQAASGALIQALGITNSMSLHPTVQRFPIDEDSIFLICSDGLSDKDRVEEYWQTEILPLLEGKVDLATVRDRLIEIANTKNGHDNVTVALVHYQVTPKSQTTEISLPPIDVKTSHLQELSVNSNSNSKFVENKPKTSMYDSEYRSWWFYVLGILILLGLGGILAYFLSPIAGEIIKPPTTEPPTTKIADNRDVKEIEQSNLPITPTFSPSLSLDVGSFILISSSDSPSEALNEPIELLTSTKDNTVKGRVASGSILKVTRKFYQPEETWLELEVCSTTKSLTTDPEFIYYLQPKDLGWIQKVKIESNLYIINMFDVNLEKLDGCFNN
ncbi:protein phosphatase 2C domain-containing protein [Okeania sp. SIO3I5]|uniref:protein phosphatase 2C domain-containing protein n=1 Tax=Okeania sp. SIO3I5 TaxID=2607805 RepID=UPI0025DFB324|nr:protein phosphatase 2C domain-containing protein [Okeania sp. SIO3I5]